MSANTYDILQSLVERASSATTEYVNRAKVEAAARTGEAL
jgi:hypothetical protein